MLDRDLAGLYGVPTKVLNQAVKRNAERFPDRFMFRLAESEMNELVTNCDRFERARTPAAPHLDGGTSWNDMLNAEPLKRLEAA